MKPLKAEITTLDQRANALVHAAEGLKEAIERMAFDLQEKGMNLADVKVSIKHANMDETQQMALDLADNPEEGYVNPDFPWIGADIEITVGDMRAEVGLVRDSMMGAADTLLAKYRGELG